MNDRLAKLRRARLYLLFTQSACALSPEVSLEGALRGGVDVVQIREKQMPDDDLAEHVRAVVERVDGRALVILNDAAHLARDLDVDGLHVGQGDLDPISARARLGVGRLLGISTHDEGEVLGALPEADYLGFGAIFPSPTKDRVLVRGPQAAARAQELAGSDCPVFAIGGIDSANVDRLLTIGVRRIAVCQAILGSPDPEAAARALSRRLYGEA